MEHGLFKQRIVGGLVLVALGAIVIPFLLDMHQEDQWWGKDNIPKKPDNGFVTRVLPLGKWSKQAQSELAQGAEQVSSVPPPPAVTAPTTPSPKPVAAPPSAAEADKPAPVTEGWVVQLGSFSSKANAEELRERLHAKGYTVFMERVAQGGQPAYRVRVGPEQQRSAADTLRDRVEREFQLKGIVLHFP